MGRPKATERDSLPGEGAEVLAGLRYFQRPRGRILSCLSQLLVAPGAAWLAAASVQCDPSLFMWPLLCLPLGPLRFL